MRELFLASFGGIHYGIWKDEIVSVRSLSTSHRIPLSPACIAGILIDDGQTVTLADIPACFGHEPTQGTEQGCILLKEGDDRKIGFVVCGELQTQSVSLKLLFALPDYLRTLVFDSCAIHEGTPIPIINITELHLRVLNPEEVPSGDSLPNPAAQPQDISAIERVRFFSAGGERFAVSATGLEDKAVKPGPITPLPNTPLYVKGVTFWNGRLLTVIDLSKRIKRQSRAAEPLTIRHELSVNAVRAEPVEAQESIHISTSSMRTDSRVDSAGSIMLIAKFGGTEFGFLIDSDEGSLHANKVEIKPAPLIVQNAWLKHMVVRSDEIIPLIDLAMTLSQSSAMSEELPVWQRYAPDFAFSADFFKNEVGVVVFLILGESYALPKVEVEDVIPFKPCRALHDVPPIVIGVAEHKGEVLPVVDLAMMFGRRSVTTPDWRMMLVKNGDFHALVLTEAVSGERQLPLEIHRPMPIHLPHNLVYGCYPDGVAARIILNVEAISVHFDKSLIQKFMPALSHQMKSSPTGEIYTFPDDKASVAAQPPAAATPPQEEEKQTPDGAAEPVDTAEQDDHAGLKPDNGHQMSGEPEVTLEMQAEVQAFELLEVQETEAIDDVNIAESLASAQMPPPVADGTSADQVPEQEYAQPAAQVSEQATIPETTVAPAELTNHGVPVNWAEQRQIIFDVIVAVSIAVFILYMWAPGKPNINKPAKESAQVKVEPGTATHGKKIEQAKMLPDTPRPAENTPAALEIYIPANMPVDIDEYVVKRGDTLWSISERFTGNPFNYPRIAGKNQIANPDLIFPGQRIRLVKSK